MNRELVEKIETARKLILECDIKSFLLYSCGIQCLKAAPALRGYNDRLSYLRCSNEKIRKLISDNC